MATREQIQPGLRYLTILTTTIATPLCIAMSIISANEGYSCRWYHCPRLVPAWPFVFLPLSLTGAASAFALLYRRKHNSMPNFRWALLDLLAFIAYLGVLIPIWSVEVRRLNRGGWGLLSGYASSPMIVNMFIHLYFFLINARLLWSWLSNSASDQCPHCHGRIGVLPQHQETVQRGEGYSLLRGEGYLDTDADAVPYSDGRPSEDQVGVTDDAPEDKGKGTIRI